MCVDHPSFTYIENISYIDNNFYIIQTDRLDLKYLTGLLNSKLIHFWLHCKCKRQGSSYQVDKSYILRIPLLIPDLKSQKYVVDLVEKIQVAFNTIAYQGLVDQLDKKIYQLYDLEEEINAINEYLTEF
jgi:adenine-specific DNA-methyltransferase